MRHRKAGKELGRNTSHRKAMLRNMVTSLLKYEQIETTDTKAKAIRPIAEKMITLAKRGDLHARRQVLAYMQDKSVGHRLFGEIKGRYLDRQGGYVRIVKSGFRKGDGAPVSIIQLLPVEEGKRSSGKKEKKRKSGKPSPSKTRKEKEEKVLTGEGKSPQSHGGTKSSTTDLAEEVGAKQKS